MGARQYAQIRDDEKFEEARERREDLERRLEMRWIRLLGEAIERGGWSGIDMQEMLGIDPTTLSRYRNGRAFPYFPRLVFMARELDISLDELVAEPGDLRPAAPTADLSILAPEPPRQERRRYARGNHGAD